jgi:hypothetical protein
MIRVQPEPDDISVEELQTAAMHLTKIAKAMIDGEMQCNGVIETMHNVTTNTQNDNKIHLATASIIISASTIGGF